MEGKMEVPTWEQEKSLLPPDLTPEQLEAVRKAGARRRQAARVQAAQGELAQLLERIIVPGVSDAHRAAVAALVFEAIAASIACIGYPGSAAGTSPPGWFRNSPNVGARVDALFGAMARIQHHGVEIPSLRVHGCERELVVMDYQFDQPTVGRIDPEWGPEYAVLCEHIASLEISRRARAVDVWIAYGGQGPAPSSPPQDLLEFYAALVAARRAGAE